MVLFFEAAGLELLWLLLVVAVVVASAGEDDEFLEFDFSMLVSSLFFVEVGEKNDIKDIFLTHGSLVYPVGLGNQCYFSSIVAMLWLWGGRATIFFLGRKFFKKRKEKFNINCDPERGTEWSLRCCVETINFDRLPHANCTTMASAEFNPNRMRS